jgi:hypothetical protein
MTYNGCYNAKFMIQNSCKTIYKRRVDDVLAGGCVQIVYK